MNTKQGRARSCSCFRDTLLQRVQQALFSNNWNVIPQVGTTYGETENRTYILRVQIPWKAHYLAGTRVVYATTTLQPSSSYKNAVTMAKKGHKRTQKEANKQRQENDRRFRLYNKLWVEGRGCVQDNIACCSSGLGMLGWQDGRGGQGRRLGQCIYVGFPRAWPVQ